RLFKPISFVLFETPTHFESRRIVPDPTGTHGRTIEHDVKIGTHRSAHHADHVDVVHGPRTPRADLDSLITRLLEARGELRLRFVGHVGLVLLAGKHARSVNPQLVASATEELRNRTAGDPADGVPH